MSEFKPGDMVECVDARPQRPSGFWNPPVVGRTYTVIDYGIAPCGRLPPQPTVWLREQQNTVFGEPDDGYAAYRFRLIKPRATDISIFKEIVEREFSTAPVNGPVKKVSA